MGGDKQVTGTDRGRSGSQPTLETLRESIRPIQEEVREKTQRILRKISQTGMPAVRQEEK